MPTEDAQPSEQQAIAAVPKQLLIGGQWRDASQGKTFSIEDPATGRPLCEVADGTPEDALAALTAADEASADWAANPPPLTVLALGQILRDAGLPDGVLNILTSSSSGSVVKPLLEDSRLRKLSFTGSTEVGRLLMEQSSGRLLRLSMELGGNAPFIV